MTQGSVFQVPNKQLPFKSTPERQLLGLKDETADLLLLNDGMIATGRVKREQEQRWQIQETSGGEMVEEAVEKALNASRETSLSVTERPLQVFAHETLLHCVFMSAKLTVASSRGGGQKCRARMPWELFV